MKRLTLLALAAVALLAVMCSRPASSPAPRNLPTVQAIAEAIGGLAGRSTR